MVISTAVLRSNTLPRAVKSVLYRGGTSRGLIFNDMHLTQFDAPTRERILCAASSPDPDGRQIDGIGGGASSLSKIAILSRPGSIFTSEARKRGHPFAGVEWADNDPQRVQSICDVVYRFGQVPINDTKVDWGSTCGNLVAAAAHFAIANGVILRSVIAGRLPQRQIVKEGEQHTVGVRLLAHDSGKIVTAHVPVELVEDDKFGPKWMPSAVGGAEIAGVPGKHPGIIVESPLEGSVLSTGNPRDEIEVDGEKISVSVVDTGLPVIFVSAEELGIPLSVLGEHPAAIDANVSLMQRLEKIRHAASQLTPELSSRFTPPAPKICVIHPRANYVSTGGSSIKEEDMDILIRSVSVGQLHRTVPATTLSALSAALSFPESLVSEVIAKSSASSSPSTATQKALTDAQSTSSSTEEPVSVKAITVGQPAGLSTASVQIDQGTGQPKAILMLRTARRIMEGRVLVPGDCKPHPDLVGISLPKKTRRDPNEQQRG